MDNLLGLLRIHVKRGINLAVRDMNTSDPYAVVKLGRQKFKTRVVPKDVNPVWNEDLTLSISDPNLPIKLTIYDHDTFSKDDKMGEADFDIKDFVEAMRMNILGLPEGTVLARVSPSRQNCLADESCISWTEGKVSQHMILRLKNVERGEVEISLHWIDLPGSKGL
ncbi:protein C2-DOMAIN ABA-RELATED 4-like [Impatiens glandulifera]|uniref:protein C2-DOMAIN ABA-RELATED 4-like n=1 Tax=Impatiens glandulifera TaxID=253017 RepID=UPI001FB15BBE|nr:protein C2-DOMAIN ABA-RELATED 4-like [Impatiens glandulifera]